VNPVIDRDSRGAAAHGWSGSPLVQGCLLVLILAGCDPLGPQSALPDLTPAPDLPMSALDAAVDSGASDSLAVPDGACLGLACGPYTFTPAETYTLPPLIWAFDDIAGAHP